MSSTSPGPCPARTGRRRRLGALALVLAGGLLASACGSDAEEADDSAAPEATDSGAGADSEGTTAPAAGTFPVTVDHKYGSSTIDAEPQRVVSVGFNDQDFILALGVTPVGIRDWYGDQPYATWSWAQDELGDAQPEVLSSEAINLEAVAALDPDLIIGVSSGMTQDEYDLLSKIAPTITQPAEYVDYGTPWQDATLMIGRALGREAQAEQLVADTEAKFAAAAAEHPEFAGATAAVAFVYNDLPGAYASSDGRARILGDLGFATPPEYDELAGDAFFVSFSAEQVDLLDQDVLTWFVGSEPEAQAVLDLDLRPQLAAYQDGREIFIGQELGGAFSFGSPLSFGYLLEELVPRLAAALDGDPSTDANPDFDEDAAPAAATDTTATAAAETGDDSPEAAAAQEAWALVFDSAAPVADKADHLTDADALAGTLEAYAAAGEGMGGISLVPTAATVDGDTATVTYDVLFGTATAYSDLTGTVTLVDGTWVVGRDEFCGFMASARTPCPAA